MAGRDFCRSAGFDTQVAKSSETRTEFSARGLLENRGWSLARPPRGNVLWKNEYHDHPDIAKALATASKSGTGSGYPDFIVVDQSSLLPLIVGEAKRDARDVERAADEASRYADALSAFDMPVLAAGVAGNGDDALDVRVRKRLEGRWTEIKFHEKPIQWLPKPEETGRLLADPNLFSLDPTVPSPEVLAQRGDELNRLLRESAIKDEFRPAVMAAFMLALVEHPGITSHRDWVLRQINDASQKAFQRAGKYPIADSIRVNEANAKLAARAGRILRILRQLNVDTLAPEHDYIGQLYESFFRFTGGNTIGQYFTPRHIATTMADLCRVSSQDVVVDPSCGTGGFLIASMYRMMEGRRLDREEVGELVADRLYGFESEPITAALCVANMIIRGDGTTGVHLGDCFIDKRFPVDSATVVLGNPPFPHSGTSTPAEDFVDRGLEALRSRGLLAMILPVSLLHKPGKRAWRSKVLEKNALRAVIELPGELFQPYAASTTAIVLIEKGQRHDFTESVFFCRVANDGYRLKKNVRIEQPGGQMQRVVEAFRNRTSEPGFSRWAPLEGSDWGPGGYIESAAYGDDEIRGEIETLLRNEAAFHALFADRLAGLQASLRDGLLQPQPYRNLTRTRPSRVEEREGRLAHYFDIYYGQKALHNKERLVTGDTPVISASGTNKGCYGFFAFQDLIAPPIVTVPGTGSISEAFVQTWPCGVTDHCMILVPRPGVTEDIMWLAAAVIRLEKWRFNYGRGATPARIADFVIPLDDELRQFVNRRRLETANLARAVVGSLAASDTFEAEFRRLAGKWRRERPRELDAHFQAMHPAYQRIVGMGAPALPLLLAELERDLRSGRVLHWFPALDAIAGIDPVPEADRGDVRAMARAWLTWGREQGHQW